MWWYWKVSELYLLELYHSTYEHGTLEVLTFNPAESVCHLASCCSHMFILYTQFCYLMLGPLCDCTMADKFRKCWPHCWHQILLEAWQICNQDPWNTSFFRSDADFKASLVSVQDDENSGWPLISRMPEKLKKFIQESHCQAVDLPSHMVGAVSLPGDPLGNWTCVTLLRSLSLPGSRHLSTLQASGGGLRTYWLCVCVCVRVCARTHTL